MANAIQTTSQSGLKVFNQTLTNDRTQQYLAQVLGEKKQQFVNNITALVANSANLQKCEPMTLMYAGIKATALDLPLDQNLGFAYVIPYNNRKAGKTEAQFQIGYKGFIQLAIRSGQFSLMNVTDVRDGELDDADLLTGEVKFHREQHREELAIIGYAAFFQLTNGFRKTLYMSREEVEQHAKTYSQTYGSSYESTRASSKWTTDFDAMAKKTVIKLLLSKWAPLSVDMVNAQKADQAVMRDNENSYDYVDNGRTVEITDAAVEEEIAAEAFNEELGIENTDGCSPENAQRNRDKYHPNANPAPADAPTATISASPEAQQPLGAAPTPDLFND